MERGLRALTEPVDDCFCIENRNILERMLTRYMDVKENTPLNRKIYISSARDYDAVIKKWKQNEENKINMGYETRFTFEVKDIDNVGYDSYKIVKYMHEKQDQDDWFYPFDYQIDNFIREIQPEYGSAFALEFNESDDLKWYDPEKEWYDHEKEMKQLSKEFPDVLFKLHGEGENKYDIWDKYFMGGKMQSCYAEIMCPPFDRSKLL